MTSRKRESGAKYKKLREERQEKKAETLKKVSDLRRFSLQFQEKPLQVSDY